MINYIVNLGDVYTTYPYQPDLTSHFMEHLSRSYVFPEHPTDHDLFT